MELNGRPATADDLAPLALYNYGNFTTMLVTDRGVRGLGLHLDRLERDARTLFEADIDKDQVRRFVRTATEQTQKPVVVRVTIFCKAFDLVHPAQACKPDILVTTRQAPPTPLPAVSLEPMFYGRELPELKTTNVSGALHRRRLAQIDGFDDALFVNEVANISEGPTWNIGFIKGDGIILPEALYLSGTSAALLRQALQNGGRPVTMQTVGLKDVPSMDGAFIISATNGLRAVTAIGSHAFAQNDLADLRNIYEQVPYEPL